MNEWDETKFGFPQYIYFVKNIYDLRQGHFVIILSFYKMHPVIVCCITSLHFALKS